MCLREANWSHAVEVAFDALPAGDLGGKPAVLLDGLEFFDEVVAAADQGAAGAVLGTALPQDPPSGPLADAEEFLEGAAVDEVLGQGSEGRQGVGETVDPERGSRHIVENGPLARLPHFTMVCNDRLK